MAPVISSGPPGVPQGVHEILLWGPTLARSQFFLLAILLELHHGVEGSGQVVQLFVLGYIAAC